jgi:hypothetical protein
VEEAEGDTQVVEELANLLAVELVQGMLELKLVFFRIGVIRSLTSKIV